MKDLIIYGCGSLGRLIEQIVFDVNQDQGRWNLLGFIDDDQDKHDFEVAGHPVLGGTEILRKYPKSNLIMALASPHQRQRSAKKLLDIGVDDYATIIHPSAWISRRVLVGRGSLIYPGVCIDCDVRIGKHNIINKLCTLGHDSRFGDFVTVAPAVNFGGNVHIGEGCDFGINSATVQGITVGEWSIIGAGAIVTQDIPARCTAVGTPAKPIKFN